VGSVRTGNLVFLAGAGPRKEDGTYMAGRLGQDVSIEQGYQAARLTGINQLAALKAELGDLNKVKRIVKVLGMVNSTPAFTEQPKVMNGYSDLMVEVFGDRGKHARSAVGMQSLHPSVPGQPVRQWCHAELQQRHAQRPAQQRSVEDIGQEVIEAQPQRRGRRELGVAAAVQPRANAERQGEHQAAGAGCVHVGRAHTAGEREREKPPRRISDTRLEMVMVRRSLDAANAIIAGNNPSLMASAIMVMVSGAIGTALRRRRANVRRGSLPFG
jgi:enamine deaminase RidA (YjgF/YER057c/UK114 family)